MPDSTQAIVLGAVEEVPADELDKKLLEVFRRAVSSARTSSRKAKVGSNIPVYVLEYLLKVLFDDRNEIENGLGQVKDTIQERIVRSDHRELIKGATPETGRTETIYHRVVTFDEKDQGGEILGSCFTAGLDLSTLSPSWSTSTSDCSPAGSGRTSSSLTTRRSFTAKLLGHSFCSALRGSRLRAPATRVRRGPQALQPGRMGRRSAQDDGV